MSIEFLECFGSYTGTGPHGRIWQISPTRTGWRLGFRDPGDVKYTNAGVFISVEAARAAADR